MVGPWFRKTTNDKLALYGLRYDDLHDPLKDEEVAEALRRLPPDVLAARNARLRRAIDLDMKHDHLHGEMLAKQTPGESYLQDPPPQGPPAQEPPPPAQDQTLPAAPGPVPRPQAPPWGRWLDRDTNSCLNFQHIGKSMQRPLELCQWDDLEYPIGEDPIGEDLEYPIGEEY
ncbi:hypothetical protein QJQ45_004294 [Haematococcus lacustris]|nr:hypothetical protein QJQ45_004294 [Haematococcus lacustris]